MLLCINNLCLQPHFMGVGVGAKRSFSTVINRDALHESSKLGVHCVLEGHNELHYATLH